MSEKEFSLYLSLLARMLRLTEAQKAAISDELRDHLEERFHELVAAGHVREDAIRLALEDMGDAAGLAHSLLSISRQSRRRKLMRISAGSAVVLLLAAWSIVTFWPAQPGGQPGRPVIAQDPAPQQPGAPAPEGAAAVEPPEVIYLDPARTLPAELLAVVKGETVRITLNELLSLLRRDYGFEGRCLLDKTRFEEVGITGDEEVVLPSTLPLHLALDWALDDVNGEELTWVLKEGVLVITTMEAADVDMQTRMYAIQPMTALGLGTARNYDRNDIVSIIEDHTNGVWSEYDDEAGAVNVVGNVLVVKHNQRVLREVDALIAGLQHPGAIVSLSQPSQNAAIARVLGKRGDPQVSLVFSNAPLRDVLAAFAPQAGIVAILDVSRLHEVGITGDEEITLGPLKGQTYRSFFEFILENVNGEELAAIPDRGVLSITTAEYAETVLHSMRFDVEDLLKVISPQELSLLIRRHSKGEWADETGDEEHGVITISPIGIMLVRQTHRVLQEIISQLATLRSLLMAGGLPQLEPDRVETRYYRLPLWTARDLQGVIPQHIAPRSWGGIGNAEHGMISLVTVDDPGPEPEPVGGGLGGMGGGVGAFQIGVGRNIPDRFRSDPKPKPETAAERTSAVLVIRQTVAVHRQIDAFINEVLYGNPRGPQPDDPLKPRNPPGLGGGFLGGVPSSAIGN